MQHNLQLKSLRKRAGFNTQADLAQTLGVNPRTYASWERGEVKLTLGDAQRIADVLGCSLDELAGRVLEAARAAGATVGTAESLTGGLVAATLTDLPGSSDVVRGGVVSYSSDVKRDVLGVSRETLALIGAVSEETACAMAEGARAALGCDVAVSATGIAGPGRGRAGQSRWAPCGSGARTRRSPAPAAAIFPGTREESAPARRACGARVRARGAGNALERRRRRVESACLRRGKRAGSGGAARWMRAIGT